MEFAVMCTPDGVPPEKRERWIEVGMQVYGAVTEVIELPDGYACKLPNDAAMLVKTAEYISLDRLCCLFMQWEMVVKPNHGALWLRLIGGEDAKAYMRHMFETTNLLTESVALAAGFTVSNREVWVHPSDPAIRG